MKYFTYIIIATLALVSCNQPMITSHNNGIFSSNNSTKENIDRTYRKETKQVSIINNGIPNIDDSVLPDNTDHITIVSPNEFSKLLKSNTKHIKILDSKSFRSEIGKKVVQIIDVRSQEEYEGRYYSSNNVLGKLISDAINIPINSKDFEKVVLAKLDKTKPVAIFCNNGARSSKASKLLESYGFTSVFYLKDGLNGWMYQIKKK